MTSMTCFESILTILIAALLVFNIVWLKSCIEHCASYEEVLNPMYIYKHVKVNSFGAVFLCLIGHIVFAPAVPFFWIYKLCTIGRTKL